MSTRTKEDFLHDGSVDALVVKIMEACLLLNATTSLGVFFNFSGHTDQIDIRVYIDKEAGSVQIGYVCVYLSGYEEEPSEICEKLKRVVGVLNRLGESVNVNVFEELNEF